MTTVTKADIDKAAKAVTPHPIVKWYTRADGTIAAINSIGQKFTIENILADPVIPAKAETNPQSAIRNPKSAIRNPKSRK